MPPLVRYARLYVIQAWYAWRSLFGWANPFSYFTSKFGFTFFLSLIHI